MHKACMVREAGSSPHSVPVFVHDRTQCCISTPQRQIQVGSQTVVLTDLVEALAVLTKVEEQ